MPFKKGQSGNPSGRPKLDEEVRALAGKLTPKAWEVVTKLLDSDDELVRLKAAQVVFERAYGKPLQPTEISGKEGGPIRAVIIEG